MEDVKESIEMEDVERKMKESTVHEVGKKIDVDNKSAVHDRKIEERVEVDRREIKKSKSVDFEMDVDVDKKIVDRKTKKNFVRKTKKYVARKNIVVHPNKIDKTIDENVC